MLQAIIEAIKSKITGLSYVERFGGLVKVAEQVNEGENGELIVKRFPVVHSISDIDCWSRSRYLDLVPNDKRASIYYFEDVSGLRFVNSEQRETILNFKGMIRLVAWLNLGKLGIDADSHPLATDYFILDAIKVLTSKYQPTSGALYNAAIKVTPYGIPRRGREIFDKYTYDKYIPLTMYPYDAFAIEFEIDLTVNKNCFTPPTIGAEITCNDLTIGLPVI